MVHDYFYKMILNVKKDHMNYWHFLPFGNLKLSDAILSFKRVVVGLVTSLSQQSDYSFPD